MCLPVPYITRYPFSMYHPFALSHPLCNSDILSSLLASLVINDIKKVLLIWSLQVISSFPSNTWQIIRPCSLMPNFWLSQSPLLHTFFAPNFLSLNVIRGTTLFLSLHYFWYYIHVHVLEYCSLAYPTIRNMSHPFSDLTHISLFICPLFANCSITYFILLLDSFIPPLRNLCHLVRFSVIYSYLTLHLSLYSYAQGLDNCSVTITYQNPLFNVLVISNIWSVGSMFQWLLMYFFKLPNFAFHIFYTLLLTCLQ